MKLSIQLFSTDRRSSMTYKILSLTLSDIERSYSRSLILKQLISQKLIELGIYNLQDGDLQFDLK